MFTKEEKRWTIATIIALLIVSLAITPTKLTFLESLRIVFGSVYVLFLPGYLISYIFFKRKEVDHLERIALGFALSIAIVPLLIFYLNLLGLQINLINSSLTILGIVIISIIILAYKKNEKAKNKKN
nr:hypothetical protein [Nanoarchaeum sp.]